MRYQHAYLRINGTLYKDFDLLTPSRCFYGDHKYSMVTTLQSVQQLRNPDNFCIPINPPKGSSLYIVPKCKYAMDDVRKNYSIKKSIDTADYNVFSPDATGVAKSDSGYIIAVCPKSKVIYFNNSGSNPGSSAEAKNRIINLDPSIDVSDMIFAFDGTVTWLSFINPHPAYRQLLDGTLTKPCISANNLDVSSDNELTPDVLELFMQAALQCQYEQDAEKNFITTINVLNQHNWRKYPGTMSVVVNELIRSHSGIHANVRGTISRYSKPVKEIMLTPYSDFKDEADFNLCAEFLESKMNVGNQKFVSPWDMFEKCNKLGLTPSTFNTFYNSVARITPKKYEAKENQVQ